LTWGALDVPQRQEQIKNLSPWHGSFPGPWHDMAPNDVDLFRTYAIVKVPIHSTFSFDGSAADFCFRPDIRSLLGVLRAFIWPVSQFYNHGYKFAKPPFRAHRAPYPVFYRRPERPGMGS
jgi:hypothetical protein